MSSPITNLKYKLQRRFSNLGSADVHQFIAELKRFMNFVDSDTVLSATAKEIESAYPTANPEPPEIQYAGLDPDCSTGGSTHLENAAIGLAACRRVFSANRSDAYIQYVGMQSNGSLQTYINAFIEQYVRPFYEMLAEEIDDSDVVLAELIHAKRLIEWFRRDSFYNTYATQTQTGEKKLGWKLYELLFERGVEFSIEPASISGEADMVASQATRNPLVADIKVFDPEKGKNSTYIRKGLRQIHTYTHDYNVPLGYAVIFTPTAKRLTLDLPADQGIQKWQADGKTIFLVQIDIFPHDKSASQRPTPETETLTLAELDESEAS
jgi:hypothetical protein